MIVCDAPGGQGAAVAATLARIDGPVRDRQLRSTVRHAARAAALVASAPALVAAADGTTNALALADARDFRPLYGPGSAERFGLKRLELRGLQEDVDTREDLLRLAPHAGPNTRGALLVRA